MKLEFKKNSGRKRANYVLYLDLTINSHNDHIPTEIYRKLTSADAAIHYVSNRRMEHEIAACRYLINIVNNLPITDANKKHDITSIARNKVRCQLDATIFFFIIFVVTPCMLLSYSIIIPATALI